MTKKKTKKEIAKLMRNRKELIKELNAISKLECMISKAFAKY